MIEKLQILPPNKNQLWSAHQWSLTVESDSNRYDYNEQRGMMTNQTEILNPFYNTVNEPF